MQKKNRLFQKSKLIKELEHVLGNNVNWSERLLFSEHHLSHAASAYYPSPFDSAAVLTLDGVGEWTTTSLAIGQGRDLKVIATYADSKYPRMRYDEAVETLQGMGVEIEWGQDLDY